jgi:hypothetical protein
MFDRLSVQSQGLTGASAGAVSYLMELPTTLVFLFRQKQEKK